MMNPGMALGIAAAQLAQKGQYKPFKPNGDPTVVNQLITQESQKEAAKQAQTAAQIEAMKQAEMQQELQRMLAKKAAPPTPLASGIGSLGADVPMAEGGVVGYNGQTDSDVKLSVNERLARDWENFLKGTYYGSTRNPAPESPQPPTAPRPMSGAETARLQEVNAAPSGAGIATPAPRRQPAASPAPAPAAAPAAPMLPDTRESTAVNPSEAALMYAQMQGGLKELLERQSKPRERTPEELREATARKEEIERRMGEIDASKARFEQAKQERLAGQKGQGLRDLASFLSSAGGARSGLAGLGQATLRMDPILAARAAQEQQFREQELVFMDKLGERRNLVNDLRLASLKDDAGRAREDAARLRALDLEISKLGLGLGEKRAGELAIAEREREKTDATARENELNRKAQRELEAYRRQTQLMKPRELEEIHRVESLKLNELTGGKPGTATTQQKLEAIQFAHESVKGAVRAGGIDAKNNAAALRELGQWEKDVGANIKAMNAKNPQVYEDARRAKIREINATLGSTMPLDGGAGAGAVDTNNPLLKK